MEQKGWETYAAGTRIRDTCMIDERLYRYAPTANKNTRLSTPGSFFTANLQNCSIGMRNEPRNEKKGLPVDRVGSCV